MAIVPAAPTNVNPLPTGVKYTTAANTHSAAPKKKPALQAFDDDGDIPF